MTNDLSALRSEMATVKKDKLLLQEKVAELKSALRASVQHSKVSALRASVQHSKVSALRASVQHS